MVVTLFLCIEFRGKLSEEAGAKHVLLCGDVNNRDKLMGFLGQFYHQDHGQNEFVRAVALCPEEPNDSMTNLLKLPFYQKYLIWLVGSPTDAQDLERAKASTAKAIFVQLSSTFFGR